MRRTWCLMHFLLVCDKLSRMAGRQMFSFPSIPLGALLIQSPSATVSGGQQGTRRKETVARRSRFERASERRCVR